MKATVQVKDDGEPTTVDHRLLSGLLPADDLDITPEYAFKITVWSLQRIRATSRCHGSRMTAESALKALVALDVLEDAGRGLPAEIAHPGNPDAVLNVWLGS